MRLSLPIRNGSDKSGAFQVNRGILRAISKLIRQRPELLSPFAVALLLYQAKALISPMGAILEVVLTVLVAVTVRALRGT